MAAPGTPNSAPGAAQGTPGAAQLFDEAIARADSLAYDLMDKPAMHVEGQTAESLSFDDVPFRPLRGVRAVYHFFDVQRGIELGDMDTIFENFCNNGADALPDAIKPGAPVPDAAKLQVIFQKAASDRYDVLKHYIVQGGMKTADALKLARGDASTVLYRPNPWNVKKAVQMLVNRLPGTHFRWARVAAKRAQEPKWQPTPEEIAAGLSFLKKHLPPDTEDLAQLQFLLIHRTNPSPIQWWPESVIQKAVQRLTAIRADADVQYFYPLLVADLKDVFFAEILPLMLPFAKEHGLFVGGWPGVGKTQFGKIWGMMMGTYWAEKKGIANRKACWRRGKKIERFRAKPQELTELLLLDDACLGQVDVEDWKAWFDLTEGGSGDGRYNDAKYCTNAPRAMITNEINFDSEPALGFDVAPGDFWQMVRQTFGPLKDAHLYAVFKRCICLLGGRQRVYLRLPSEDPEEPIYTFTQDDVAADWLKSDRKKYLSYFHEGEHVKYPDFDVIAQQQSAWAREKIDAPKQRAPQQPQPPAAQASQAQPESQDVANAGAVRVQADSDGQYRFSAGPRCGSGGNVRGRFRFPGDAAASSSSGSGSAGGAGGKAQVKAEPLNDFEVARVLSIQQQMAAEGPTLIADSPARRRPQSQPAAASAAPPTMSDRASRSRSPPAGPVSPRVKTELVDSPRPRGHKRTGWAERLRLEGSSVVDLSTPPAKMQRRALRLDNPEATTDDEFELEEELERCISQAIKDVAAANEDTAE